MAQSLTTYLLKYVNYQQDILLVYHPTPDHTWSDRCYFLKDGYSEAKKYNHRSLLDNEVVIEFDDDEQMKNKELAEEVSTRLHSDNISHSVWHSGNKSYHVHVFLDTENYDDVSFLKRVFTKHYTYGIGKADMQMCGENSLIRAEFGVHEKTQQKKSLLRESNEYPKENMVPEDVHQKYNNWEREIEKDDVDYDFDDIRNSEAFELLSNAEKMKAKGDGRSRALFVLIHALKDSMEKKELQEWLINWYYKAGGKKLSPGKIRYQVDYHWEKNYTHLERYINDLLYEIGAEDKMIKQNS